MGDTLGTRTRGMSAALGLCLLTALVLLILAPVTRAAGNSMGFEARPLPGSPNAQLGYFKMDADPGATVSQTLLLVNTTDKAKTIRLAACDGASAVFGGVAYSESDAKPTAIGSWVDLSRESVVLPPGGTARVPFTVHVPADVTTGVHVGGVAVWEPAAATTSGSSDGSGTKATTKITMVTRMVLSVLVTTPGPAVPDLKITGVEAEARPDGMYMLVAISSDGTSLASGAGAVTLPAESFSGDIELGDMIPQSSTRYPIKWKTDPAEGTYQAQVEIHYDDTKVATWSGAFTVEADDMAALADRLVPTDKQAAAGTPWLMYGLIGGLVVIVLIMGFALLRRRRPEAR
jgi:hypothetical protein